LLRFSTTALRALAAASLLLAGPAAWPQETATVDGESGAVRLTAVRVEPERPAKDTLCRLRVVLENRGDKKISQLGFKVTLNEQVVPVYGNQLFMYLVEPGATEEIPLYNFWSSESGRPVPADRKLRVEVSLEEAVWMEVETEEETEIWTPAGPVEGLPSKVQLVLEMAPAH
jgi:hypothetical protein